MNQRRPILATLLRLTLLMVVALAVLPGGPYGTVAHAAGNTLTLSVVSARTEPQFPDGAPGAPGVTAGDPISAYKFIINADNTGDPTQNAAFCRPASNPSLDGCEWPSIRAVPGSSPIVTQGDNTDLAAGMDLPNGNYLISVMADGYKLGGAHFSVPFTGSGLVEVALQPNPLPLATVRIRVFEDNASVNGQIDVPAEQGLAGFEGHISDILGEVSTDWFGNPLCTQYTPAGDPIPGTGGRCISDAFGDIVIPNLGPNRYAATVVAPNGQQWIQTTTLEGGHDWDTWAQEAYTGYDTEFLFANEPFPFTQFGFVRPQSLTAPGTGRIKGTAVGVKVYTPPSGGVPYFNYGSTSGTRVDAPINRPWIALADLRNGDQTVYVGRGNADGTFDIPNLRASDYLVSIWDEPQDYLLDFYQVSVAAGQTVDIGNTFLAGWFADFYGSVFIDTNANGKRDPGETGLPNQSLVLKRRENTLQDQGAAAATTDTQGRYRFREAYPLTAWLIMEAYNDRFYTTGVTFQADNQPTETTVLGAGVDVGVLPIIGLAGRLDWGVLPYTAGTNGGIVGTVSYDVTRNELEPRFAAVEDWQPGIPGLNVNLYATVKNPDGSFVLASDGSYAKGALLNSTPTESWERPTDCVARDVNGAPAVQQALPTAAGSDCIEAPMLGTQFQTGFSAVDGNYGFGTIAFDQNGDPIPEAAQPPLPAGDYLVEVEIPTDSFGRPLYKVTKEEDINVFDGDQYIPQIPPPECAGALHTVDVAGVGTDGPNAVDNPNFADGGGSPYEGQARPLCDVKLVPLQDRRSIAPTFNLFTDVPIPGRFAGLIVDDLNFSVDPRDTLYGEKAGIPNAPIGIYDYTNRLVTSIQADPNGLFEVLLPSTYDINCPTPSGVCPSMYRLVGNDPGQPDQLNPTYNPQFRTISANFQIWPGEVLPADLAPTQVGVSILGPGSTQTIPAKCALDVATPQLFAVSQPYVNGSGSFTIQGQGFGATQGTGSVTLDGTISLPPTSWADGQIVVSVPAGTPVGPHQLSVKAGNGQSTINGLTFHVRGGAYLPTLYEVGPGKPYSTIQGGLEAAASTPQALVVVYPGATATFNPQGAYFENIVMHSAAKLQGVGPGGLRANNSYVRGSVIDGTGFGDDNAKSQNWRTLVAGQTWSGNQQVYEGEVIYILARDGQFGAGYKPAIDGLTIQGGDPLGFPNNINPIGGGPIVIGPDVEAGVVIAQGGGIFANAFARNLQITNNVLQSNGGAYGGAIRMGTPDIGDNQNDNLRIANNRIFANGGSNLAGAIALFNGTEGYEIASNDLCGNFSAEYGGGISHFGFSPNGKIHHNRIYFNRSYDEGGGVMIAGELPANPNTLSPGSGPVDIYNNIIQANLGNDDGGGLRFLMAGNFPINVYNNMIVNNISTHEGGGVALNDATNLRFFNNTVMKNITTATAVTSDGRPAPAGLSDSGNSVQLQATLAAAHAPYSDPLLFNNIFWDNRAGNWTNGGVAGIGLAGDPNPVNYWDLGVSGGLGNLAPTNSLMQVSNGTTAHPSNLVGVDPQVVSPYNSSVAISPWRTDPNFLGAAIVALDLPPNLMGDYHLQSGSPAINLGAASKPAAQAPSPVSAPATDLDGGGRPAGGGFDTGADEFGAGPPPPAPPPAAPSMYLSLADNGTVTGATGPLAVADEDILSFNGTSFGMVFDGSDIGSAVANADIRDFAIVNSNTILMSFGSVLAAGSLPGIPASFGAIDDSDIVQFNGTLGTATSGAFSVFFDGSDVGLAAATEDVDAIELLPGGKLVISTAGRADVPGIPSNLLNPSALSHDLIMCTGTFGPTTTCSWSVYFDGSDVGLGTTLASFFSENIDGLAIAPNGSIYLSAAGNFSVPGVSGADEDVFVCGSPTAGPNTACTYAPALFFDGSTVGLGSNNVDAIDLSAAVVLPTVPAGPVFATALLDSFAPQNGPVGSNWRGLTSSFAVQDGQIQVNGSGYMYWKKEFKANQEARITFTQVASAASGQGLLLKINNMEDGLIEPRTSAIRVRYDATTGSVLVETLAKGQGAILRATFGGVTFAASDTFSAQALADGTVKAFKNGSLIGSANVTTGATPWPSRLVKQGGSIGVDFAVPATAAPNGAAFDDFGGGTLP